MSGEAGYLAVLAAGWAAYFVIHSLAASLRCKRWVAAHQPRLMPLYRLLFNLQSVVLVLPLLWLTYRWPGPLLWQWEGVWRWLADGAALFAVLLFAWSLSVYDGGRFIGLHQWRSGEHEIGDGERLKLSLLHRYVRHPWYALGLVIVWTRSMDAAMLVAATAVTIYLVVGSRLEERKLLDFHGEAYRRYMQRVPGLIPLPGRRLSADEARKLVALADTER